MNILFLSSWYPTKTNPNFGVFVKEHAHAIKTTGNEIIVLAFVIHKSKKIFSISLSDNFDKAGVRTVLIELNTCFRDILYHAVPLQYYLVKSVFKKKIQPHFNPDIIHSNVIFPAGIIGHWLSKSLNKPHVITEHWTRIRHFMQTPLISYWGKKAYEGAARILPVSFYLQQEITPYLPNNHTNKFRIIGNVIDSNIFLYKEKRQITNELKLCSIATWSHLKDPAKQPELLIHALSELQKEIDQTILLTMIGGGDKVPELKKLCVDKSVKADFTGYLEKPEIAIKLQDSDFFVHPTKVETFGVVVAEALLTGTPVVCSNVSALKELVNDKNGILCNNTVHDWLEGIRSAINKDFERKQIALDIKQKYDKTNIGIAICEVYNEILN